MPKIKTDYSEEIKLRASKEFIKMCNGFSLTDRDYLLGDKNFSEFIRAAILYWCDIHAPKLMDKDIPEVIQYKKNKKKVVRNRELLMQTTFGKETRLKRLLRYGANDAIISYYFKK